MVAIVRDVRRAWPRAEMKSAGGTSQHRGECHSGARLGSRVSRTRARPTVAPTCPPTTMCTKWHNGPQGEQRRTVRRPPSRHGGHKQRTMCRYKYVWARSSLFVQNTAVSRRRTTLSSGRSGFRSPDTRPWAAGGAPRGVSPGRRAAARRGWARRCRARRSRRLAPQAWYTQLPSSGARGRDVAARGSISILSCQTLGHVCRDLARPLIAAGWARAWLHGHTDVFVRGAIFPKEKRCVVPHLLDCGVPELDVALQEVKEISMVTSARRRFPAGAPAARASSWVKAPEDSPQTDASAIHQTRAAGSHHTYAPIRGVPSRLAVSAVVSNFSSQAGGAVGAPTCATRPTTSSRWSWWLEGSFTF